MKEKWIPWKIIDLQGRHSYMSSIIDDPDGFKVIMPVKNFIEIEINFPTGVLAYHCLEESLVLDRFGEIAKKYGVDFLRNNQFFIVEDSGYVDYLEKNAGGIFSKDDMIHYAIIDDDYLLDIVCTYEPQITIRNIVKKSE